MEWITTIVAGLVLVVITAPLAMLLLTVFVLVPLAHLTRRPEMLARATFECPVSKTAVNASFVASPEREGELDVVACSVFGDGKVTCQKTCRALASVGWAPSPMVPRFSLLADGTAPR